MTRKNVLIKKFKTRVLRIDVEIKGRIHKPWDRSHNNTAGCVSTLRRDCPWRCGPGRSSSPSRWRHYDLSPGCSASVCWKSSWSSLRSRRPRYPVRIFAFFSHDRRRSPTSYHTKKYFKQLTRWKGICGTTVDDRPTAEPVCLARRWSV